MGNAITPEIQIVTGKLVGLGRYQALCYLWLGAFRQLSGSDSEPGALWARSLHTNKVKYNGVVVLKGIVSSISSTRFISFLVQARLK